jgi:hypothetical protein
MKFPWRPFPSGAQVLKFLHELLFIKTFLKHLCNRLFKLGSKAFPSKTLAENTRRICAQR